jgi:putative flippase GtrA
MSTQKPWLRWVVIGVGAVIVAIAILWFLGSAKT